ncbi:MAG: pyridoxal 5'-phosphate synthase glutaminase subunit PdxT [Deltaproteobacteria bacterium]|nr:pyridoxal 5'-phosphate synthase glutaminase subunit PdxT [Deltaproteobacteria bacterium]
MKIGILALQGDFRSHAERLAKFGADTLLIKKAGELSAVDGLVLPGGESTALLTLLTPELKEGLAEKVRAGLPVFATCAGLILIAQSVRNPEQESLGLLDVEVTRNAYGRQVDSFISEELKVHNRPPLFTEPAHADNQHEKLEGVFIRAPKITHCGAGVNTIVSLKNDPVLVRQDNILAGTFHPELSDRCELVYKIFFGLVEKSVACHKAANLPPI